MSRPRAIIVGGGISGIAAALAFDQIGLEVVVYELRTVPATVGGAVNLTPTALRYLDHLGVLDEARNLAAETRAMEVFSIDSGRKLGIVDFDRADKVGYGAMRITRWDLLSCLLAGAKKRDINIQYGAKLVEITERSDKVTAKFADGRRDSGDLLIGADGIFSATRMKYVDPGSKPVYTGCVAAGGILRADLVKSPIHFKDAAVNLSENGMLVTAYCNKERSNLYIAVTMSKPDEAREGWTMTDQEAKETKKYMIQRYASTSIPCIKEIIDHWDDQFYWPVRMLESQGSWWKGRVGLMGDACHAMPPNGESVGFCLEDAVLLSTLFQRRGCSSPSAIFQEFESLRRHEMEQAKEDALVRWGSAGKVSWLRWKVRELLAPWYFWWTQGGRDAVFAKDVRTMI
ncbi:uncharacterized protein Z520_01667 [Fonsecaea multimorphosa CBS 102226]|uniref:FAD-binding domain-containing protein n=1 Tax=Fonsecaea multimorphosa CBS 102226 TaxID=1442371 RepID=A0A0D2KI91_9EURO|nr:uncharacterized protein Z520_01667 [Fonsecaea multimorphosa CBS 102226]KIY03200.1 hypothetical protein Z520_01667 [Fonsecaea multimorphosa CBS 102226]OAL30441.1 hypothetical protein AYO22_01639 [Fonsecaea multimorphosa]